MRKLVLMVTASAAVFVPVASHALGLGEIKVNSALNQPLDAEVDILAARPGEVEELIVSLADADTFRRAGLERPFVLTKLRFEVQRRPNGQPYIRITSRDSVREPFLSFLLEADWAKGRVIREFTVLLDPPAVMARQSAPAPAPAAEPAPRPEPYTPEPAYEAPPEPVAEAAPEPEYEPAPEPAYEPAPEVAYEPAPEMAYEPPAPAQEPPLPQEPVTAAEEGYPADGEWIEPVETGPIAQGSGLFESEETRFPLIPIEGYTPTDYYGYGWQVEPGDTLWEIVEQTRTDESITMAQMMLAYLRANPEAFVDNNVNRLKKGYVLRIPSNEDATAVDPGEAVALVSEQNALWREYVASVTGETYPQGPGAEGGAGAVAEPAGEESNLALLAPGEGEASVGVGADPAEVEQLRRAVALSEEALEAAKVENSELRERVAMLEEQVTKMQRLIELKQDELAEIQFLQRQQEAVAEPEALAPVEDPEAADVAPPEQETLAPVAEAPEPGAAGIAGDDLLEPLPEPAAELDAAGEETLEPPPAAVPADDAVVAQGPGSAPEAEAPAAPPPQTLESADVGQEQGPIARYLPFLANLSPGSGGWLSDPLKLGAFVGLPLLLLLGGALAFLRMRGGKEPAAAAEGALSFDDTDDLTETEEVRRAESTATRGVEDTTVNDLEEDAPPAADSTVLRARAQAPSEAEVTETGDAKEDAISEVDVYLAYGLYQQAEELLRELLEEQPQRADYHLKLLETHFAAKNREGFVAEAEVLHGLVGSDGGEVWDRALAMGAELAPDHRLFSGADTTSLTAPRVEFEKPDTADINLDAEDTQTHVTDLEVSEAFTGAPDLSMTESLDLDEIGALGGQGQAQKPRPEAEAEPPLERTGDYDTTQLLTPEEQAMIEDADAEEEPQGEGIDFEETALLPEEPEEADEGQRLELDATDFTTTADETRSDLPELGEDELSLEIEEPRDAAAEVGETPEPEEAEVDFEETMMALPDFDLPGGKPSAKAEAAPDEETVAMNDPADIALDETVAVETGGREGGVDESEDEDLTLPPDVDEIGTKLDLAKAFIDMGDTDGARGTLEEVLEEGSDAQREEAERLMKQIA